MTALSKECSTPRASVRPRTLYQKIVDAHTVKTIDAGTVLLYCDAHFANEYTSPQAFAGVRDRGIPVAVPDAHLCVVDHVIPSEDVSPRVIHNHASLVQAETLEANCRHFGIDAFYGPNDPDQGVEHVLMDEQGLVRPGKVVICGDIPRRTARLGRSASGSARPRSSTSSQRRPSSTDLRAA